MSSVLGLIRHNTRPQTGSNETELSIRHNQVQEQAHQYLHGTELMWPHKCAVKQTTPFPPPHNCVVQQTNHNPPPLTDRDYGSVRISSSVSSFTEQNMPIWSLHSATIRFGRCAMQLKFILRSNWIAMPVQNSEKSFFVERTPFLVHRARGAIEHEIAQ